MTDRSQNLRVERAAVAAVEASLLRLTDLSLAMPFVDHGVDLIAFRPHPFAAAGVQVKGAAAGLTVYRKYIDEPVLVAYVLDPLGDEPRVLLYTGEQALNLPIEYVKRGGRAADHDAANNTYRWSRIPALLREVLDEALATPQPWESLFERVRAR
jgi:hypothetical protein